MPSENYSNGQLGSPVGQDPFTTKLAGFHQAKMEFDSSCHRLAEAQQLRAQAEKRLADASKAVADMVSNALNDPTVPQAPPPPQMYPSEGISKARY